MADFNVEAWFVDWWRKSPVRFHNPYSAGAVAAQEAVKAYQRFVDSQCDTKASGGDDNGS